MNGKLNESFKTFFMDKCAGWNNDVKKVYKYIRFYVKQKIKHFIFLFFFFHNTIAVFTQRNQSPTVSFMSNIGNTKIYLPSTQQIGYHIQPLSVLFYLLFFLSKVQKFFVCKWFTMDLIDNEIALKKKNVL